MLLSGALALAVGRIDYA